MHLSVLWFSDTSTQQGVCKDTICALHIANWLTFEQKYTWRLPVCFSTFRVLRKKVKVTLFIAKGICPVTSNMPSRQLTKWNTCPVENLSAMGNRATANFFLSFYSILNVILILFHVEDCLYRLITKLSFISAFFFWKMSGDHISVGAEHFGWSV